MNEDELKELEAQKINEGLLAFEQNPRLGLLDHLTRVTNDKGEALYSFRSPFTRFILTNLGQSRGQLRALQEMATPFNSGSGLTDGSLHEFSGKLVNSLVGQGESPFGDLSLMNYADAGRAIAALLADPDTSSSPITHSIAAQAVREEMNALEIKGQIDIIIDTFGAFSMSDMHRAMVKNGLDREILKYYQKLRDEGLTEELYSFATHLVERGADWLFKWWKKDSQETTPNMNAGHAAR